MDILILIFGFVVGLIFLVKGADEMVDSSVQIALKFKIEDSSEIVPLSDKTIIEFICKFK